MKQTPAEEIREARKMLEEGLNGLPAREVRRACEQFSSKTGLAVNCVIFRFADTEYQREGVQAVYEEVILRHEEP